MEYHITKGGKVPTVLHNVSGTETASSGSDYKASSRGISTVASAYHDMGLGGIRNPVRAW
jgi:hypothetical protein